MTIKRKKKKLKVKTIDTTIILNKYEIDKISNNKSISHHRL